MFNNPYPFYIIIKDKDGYYSCVSMYNETTSALLDRWYEIQRKETEMYGHPCTILEEIVLVEDPQALPAATYPDKTIRIVPSVSTFASMP